MDINVLVEDFEDWLDEYMQGWSCEEIHDCTTDYSSIMNDDSELCKFLDAYPQYDMILLMIIEINLRKQ